MRKSRLLGAVYALGTLLLGGVAASETQAATVSYNQQFFMSGSGGVGGGCINCLLYPLFDPTLGMLTGVSFDLDSAVLRSTDFKVTADIIIAGYTLATYSTEIDSTVDFDFAGSGLVGFLTLDDYTGVGYLFTENLFVEMWYQNFGPNAGTTIWTGTQEDRFSINGRYSGLTLTYTFDVSAVPVPPALWLFGTGLLGLIGIARR